ncbi:MAG: hypothetical protein K2N05_04445 [Muribaculaceae bacterium]|nr:hypothetical protein [Muribaculaceae bacterium]
MILMLLRPSILRAHNEITYSFYYSPENLSISSVKGDGVLYSDIQLGSFYQTGDEGHPALPVDYATFSVPSNATDFKVTTEIEEMEEMKLVYPPFPNQPPIPTSTNENIPSFTHLDLQSASHVMQPATIETQSTIGGFSRVLKIRINPVEWNRESNSLSLRKKIRLNISWSSDNDILTGLCRPLHQKSIDNAITNTKFIVVNPEDVEANCDARFFGNTNVNSKVASQVESQYEYIPYMIVTTKKLSKKMERLAALRRLRGFNSKVVCIEDILESSESKYGDFISNINDDAGKLRGFLFYAHQRNGTDYVLLAGPYPEIPGRWVYAKNFFEESTYVSDQYFRDLNHSWPKETATSYGNIEDIRFMSFDLNVGRITFSTEKEVDNYINKILQYEFNLRKVDQSYLDRAYIQFGNDSGMYKAFNRTSRALYFQHFPSINLDTVALTQIYWGSEAITNINAYPAGFVDWRTHGGTAGVSIYDYNKVDEKKSGSTGISPLDKCTIGFIEESKNGLNNLTNEDYPSWTLSTSCTLAEIGKEKDFYTFAESYIMGDKYGGVAFIGNSEAGYIVYSPIFCRSIFNSGLNLYESGINMPYAGLIVNQGGMQYFSNSIIGRYLPTVVGLTGDPLVPLWFRKPSVDYKKDVGFPTDILSLEINIGQFDFTNKNSEYWTSPINKIGFVEDTLNETKILYRSDMCPYISTSIISGLDVTSSMYFFTGRLKTKNDLTLNKEALTVRDKNILQIEALEEAEITGNLKIEKEARFSVLSHQPITIHDCNVSTGIMEYNTNKEVIISKNVVFEKGAVVTIK